MNGKVRDVNGGGPEGEQAEPNGPARTVVGTGLIAFAVVGLEGAVWFNAREHRA